MTDDQDRQDEPQPGSAPPERQAETSRKDRVVKWVFLGVVLIAVIAIYFNQRTGPDFDWPANLRDALAEAERTDRRVVAFFMNQPPGALARWNIQNTLRKSSNRQALDESDAIRVQVRLDSLEAPLAREYRIEDLPTMLLLSPEGEELNRRTGKIGEVDFRDGFLNLAKIQEPPRE